MMKFLETMVIPKWLQTTLIYVLLFSLVFGFLYWVYDCGVSAEHERNVAADNVEIANLAQYNFELQTKARDSERQNVLLQNQLTSAYEKRNENAKINTSKLIRSVDTGALKLRIATKTEPACSSDSATISAATSPAQETRAELSKEASQFLISFASECDGTAEKLNLCIDIAESDRKANSLENLTLGSEVQPATGSVSSNSFNAALTSLNESHGSAVMSTSIDLTNKEIQQ